jgi:hypothetical protein
MCSHIFLLRNKKSSNYQITKSIAVTSFYSGIKNQHPSTTLRAAHQHPSALLRASISKSAHLKAVTSIFMGTNK